MARRLGVPQPGDRCLNLRRFPIEGHRRNTSWGPIVKMVGFGMKSPESELAIVAEYLAKHYPADAMPPINVNTASAIELESRFSMKRSESNAFIAYREKTGKIKTFADLMKAPGINPEKVEAKKTQIVF